jgi:hypothetical protein
METKNGSSLAVRAANGKGKVQDRRAPFAKMEGSIMPRAKIQVAMENAVEKAGIEWRTTACGIPFAVMLSRCTASPGQACTRIIRKEC